MNKVRRYLEQPVSLYDKEKAVFMWKESWNTLEIAQALKLPEFQVYNSLPTWRRVVAGQRYQPM